MNGVDVKDVDVIVFGGVNNVVGFSWFFVYMDVVGVVY